MLEPDDRHPLLDMLRPPAGFVLDRAVGTTFSLDLFALLTAPVAFALLEEDRNEEGLVNPTTILEAIRRNANRMDVFCQAGQIGLPTEYRPLIAYVENVIHEVSAPTRGRVFHPKVWILRFKSAEAERHYRLLCLSRNLTFDRSWDTVLCLDGVSARRTQKLSGQNRPLSRFIGSLPSMARGLEKVRADAVRELADEVLAVEFDLPADFYGLRFWPLGIRGLPSWPFADEGWANSRLLVVSPFLSPGLLGRLHAPGTRDVLVSRAETLDSLEEEHLQDFEETFALRAEARGSDDAVGRSLGSEDEELAEQPDYPLSGLHAKLFISEFHHMAKVWTGSANATNAAFAGNVEFLVELQGPRSRCGVDAMLEGGAGGVKFRDLLETYEPSGPAPPETEQQQLERRLDDVRREIAALGFEAAVDTEDSDDESYSLLVRATSPDDFGGLRGLRAHLWPITLGSGSAKPLAPVLDGGIRFSPVSFAALTAFYAIELNGQSGGAHASLRFVVNAELLGAPANRYDRLLTSILRDKSDVIRYLLLLLADDRVTSLVGGLLRSNGSARDGWASSAGMPVLESMVRTLARDPERLDHVARLIDGLRASEEGRVLVPDELDSVWEPIWHVRQRLRS